MKKIKMVIFQDDAHGEYGLTHENTVNQDSGFNAFWDGKGIFNDVFEHYFEGDKYFQGDNFMNVGGEMAAMGHMVYYCEQLGIEDARSLNRMFHFTETALRTTLDMVHESISHGLCDFGYSLESGVPRQRPTDSGEVEYLVEEFMGKIRGARYEGDYPDDELEESESYRKSVTRRKVADLHRWGYRQAGRLVPDRWENSEVLRDFIQYWDNFCKWNNAGDMIHYIESITFSIKKKDGVVSWSARLEPIYWSEMKAITLNKDRVFSVEDMYI